MSLSLVLRLLKRWLLESGLSYAVHLQHQRPRAASLSPTLAPWSSSCSRRDERGDGFPLPALDKLHGQHHPP